MVDVLGCWVVVNGIVVATVDVCVVILPFVDWVVVTSSVVTVACVVGVVNTSIVLVEKNGFAVVFDVDIDVLNTGFETLGANVVSVVVTTVVGFGDVLVVDGGSVAFAFVVFVFFIGVVRAVVVVS